MIFQVINPPKFESVKDILENAMIQQNVDKVEDLKWIIVQETMTTDEFNKKYGAAKPIQKTHHKTYCMECDREMIDPNMMICSGCRRQC